MQVLDSPLDDINDERNGILLALQLHAPFGASEVAFFASQLFNPIVFHVVGLIYRPPILR
jgi:hypothetical protein